MAKRISAATGALAGALLTAMPAGATDANRASGGALPDGTPVDAVTLTNAQGVSARILAYGATLQKLVAPDRNGKLGDVVLGYDDLSS